MIKGIDDTDANGDVPQAMMGLMGQVLEVGGAHSHLQPDHICI